MLASTLRILEAADFAPRQAAAIAEAITGELHAAQFVTVPILDDRMRAVDEKFRAVDERFRAVDRQFMEVKLEIAQLEARMTVRMMTFGIAAVGVVVTTTFFIVQHFR